MALAQGDAWPSIWGSVGTFIIGALGLRRAYRATLRFYHGQPSGRPTKKPPEAKATQRRAANFLEKEMPAVPQEATAMALASFRSMTRAPEVKMSLTTSFVMLLVFGAMFFVRGSQAPPEQ